MRTISPRLAEGAPGLASEATAAEAHGRIAQPGFCRSGLRNAADGLPVQQEERASPAAARLERGIFTLSFDFELIWGTLDLLGPEMFRRRCELEREFLIERLLGLLDEHLAPMPGLMELLDALEVADTPDLG